MITVAKVVEVNPEYTVVETTRKSACNGCHKNADGSSCNICTIMGSDRTAQSKAVNKIGAKVGDKVEISSNTGRILYYAMLVFIAPVVCGLAAYFIAQYYNASNTVVYVSVILAFILPFIPVAIYSSVVVKKRCDVVIVKIL